MESIWSAETKLPEFQKLNGDIKTDVLIIGGGISGILTAYMLKQQGIDCIVAEGDKICSGTTKNTTAKITSQHGLIYQDIIKNIGKEKTKMYYEINQTAIDKYRELCQGIDCDFKTADNYVYSVGHKEKLERELDALHRSGINADYSDRLALPFSTAGAVRFKNQAQFNPLKFIASITEKLKIYENTFIREIQNGTAIYDYGNITADKIVVASHFPFINKHGSYFLKLYQHRSYVIALKNAAELNGMYVDEDKKGLSFRNYGDYLILGGGSHRTGKDGGNWNELRKFAQKYYPKSVEKYSWSAQDCMSLDSIPYIGRYSKRTHELYTITGFNKWGMTGAMSGAMIISDMITGKENAYAGIFDPSRSVMKPQLFINLAETTVNFFKPTLKRCPHLGCALKWNKAEHSWDCPCHGSRFTENGKLIDNPATGNIKK